MKYNSNEEWYFSIYLDELKSKGIINNYLYESNTFTLSDAKKYYYTKRLVTKSKRIELHLLDHHSYTPDFLVEWSEEYDGVFYRCIDNDGYTTKPPFLSIRSRKNNKPYTFFEVKGSFDMNNMTRLFKLNQKWLYDKYKLYVMLVSIPDLFKRTFVPERYLLTDSSRQKRKINFGIKLYDEYYKWLLNSKYNIHERLLEI